MPITENNWNEKALCIDVPLDYFFIDKINSKNKTIIKYTYNLCDTCPVASHCLQDALKNDDEGVRAGTNFHHRQYILKRYFNNNKKALTLDRVSHVLYSIKRMPVSTRMNAGRNFFKRIGSEDDLS